MKKHKYSHLNKTKFNNAYDWQSTLFQRALPPRAFVNEFTGGFLLAIQKMLVTGMDKASVIKSYFRF